MSTEFKSGQPRRTSFNVSISDVSDTSDISPEDMKVEDLSPMEPESFVEVSTPSGTYQRLFSTPTVLEERAAWVAKQSGITVGASLGAGALTLFALHFSDSLAGTHTVSSMEDFLTEHLEASLSIAAVFGTLFLTWVVAECIARREKNIRENQDLEQQQKQESINFLIGAIASGEHSTNPNVLSYLVHLTQRLPAEQQATFLKEAKLLLSSDVFVYILSDRLNTLRETDELPELKPTREELEMTAQIYLGQLCQERDEPVIEADRWLVECYHTKNPHFLLSGIPNQEILRKLFPDDLPQRLSHSPSQMDS